MIMPVSDWMAKPRPANTNSQKKLVNADLLGTPMTAPCDIE
jgi:hypothetical protein